MGTFNGKKLPNFIQFSEIEEANENKEEIVSEGFGSEEETPDTDTPPAEGDSAPAATDDSAAPAEGEGAAAPAGDGAAEGSPEIIKVYTDSEEDKAELEEAGIDLTADAGTGEEGSEAPAEGEEAEEPKTPVYIKVKTVDGDEKILKFTEKDEENRTPVEDSQDLFDTVLSAEDGEHEYSIAAEITVTPDGGTEINTVPATDPETGEEAPVEVGPAPTEEGEGSEATPPAEGAPSEDDDEDKSPIGESFIIEKKIMNFEEFTKTAQ